MAFTIRWTNNNPGASTVKLYRDTKPLVRTALPEPWQRSLTGKLSILTEQRYWGQRITT